MKHLKRLLIVAVVGLVTACSCPPPGNDTSPLSPLPTAKSPLATEVAPIGNSHFALSKPLTHGDTVVSGAGPAGLKIIIADMTMMGEVLGQGRIDSDGRFTVPVDPALIANHRIGIMLDSQAADTVYTEELLARLDVLKGEDAMWIPHVGFAYDSALVIES